MPKGRVDEEIAMTETLGSVVKAYEEIAIMKMQASREQVLNNRFFMIGLSDMFLEIQTAYRSERAVFGPQPDEGAVFQYTTLERSKDKTAAVLISPNQRLSGSVVYEVVEKYLKFVQENPAADTVIIGKIGYEQFIQLFNKEPTRFFPLKHSETDPRRWQEVISFLIEYSQVEVFFGTFVNLMAQVATEVNLTGKKPEVNPNKKIDTGILNKYIFEPSVYEILHYFESQVFGTFLRITGQESFLAEMGSRVTAMEEATGKVDRRLTVLGHEAARQRHNQYQRKLLTTLAGRNLWHN